MHSKHTTSSLQALYRVFVLPALSKPTASRIKPLPASTPHPINAATQRRAFSHSSIRNAKTRAPEQRTQLWDHEIKAWSIYLINPETNRRSETTYNPYSILENLDLKTHRLVQLTPPDSDEKIPTCRIVSKKEEFDREKKKKAQLKEQRKIAKVAGEAGEKTVELNWAIDANDLAHRLQKAKEFLEEGRRVEVVFNSKKRGRKASREECEGVLKKVREVVDEVQGARVKMELEGVIGKFAKMELQGPAPGGSGKEKDKGAAKSQEQHDAEMAAVSVTTTATAATAANVTGIV